MAETGDIRSIPGLTGLYARFLSFLLRRPATGPSIVVVLAVASLIGLNVAYVTFGKGVEFFPDVEPEQALIYVHARGNMSISEQDGIVAEIEQRVLQLDDFDTVYTRAGKRDNDGSDISEDVIGIINLELKDWDERRPANDIFDDIRAVQLTSAVLLSSRASRKPARRPARTCRFRSHPISAKGWNLSPR